MSAKKHNSADPICFDWTVDSAIYLQASVGNNIMTGTDPFIFLKAKIVCILCPPMS